MSQASSMSRPCAVRARVLLADDHVMLLDMLQALLETEFDIVGTVNDGQALLEVAQRLEPDIALIDIAMPGMSGLEAGRELHGLRPDIKLIYLTMESDVASATEAFQNGASAYILKTSPAEDLLRATRIVAEGGCYLTPTIAGGDVEGLCHEPADNLFARLTEREIEVLRLTVAGFSMKSVARKLGIVPRTVAFHKYRAMDVLGLHGNPELVKFAMRHALLPTPSAMPDAATAQHVN